MKNEEWRMKKGGRGLSPVNASGVAMDTVLANLAIDGFTGATRLRNWNVYVNGQLNAGYGLMVVNGRLVICPHGIGMAVIVK